MLVDLIARIRSTRLPKNGLGILAFGCGFCLIAAGTRAETLHYTYDFDASRLVVEEVDGENLLQVEGWSRTWESKRPEVPFEVLTFLVPRGARVVDLRGLRIGETTFRENVQLAEAGPRHTQLGHEVLPPESRWPAKSTGAYPQIVAEAGPSGALHGYQLLSVRVFPIRIDAQDRVRVSARIQIEIELAQDRPNLIARERYRENIESAAKETLARLVVNPEAIAGYDRPIGKLVKGDERGFRPTDAPSLEGSPVDYVIITGAAFETEMQVLADWKTARGIPTVVRTLDWILANYRHGSDVQETIRTFIQDAYAKWGITYVLLAGDTGVLPARYLYSDFGPEGEEDIPCDMYFACLDGNYNADGDGFFGEAAVSAQNLVDDPDLYAEVFAGRLPVSSASNATTLVNKIIEYESPSITDYQGKAIFLGEVLFPVDWDGQEPISMDGASFSEEMAANPSPCASLEKLYENYNPYPGAIELTKNATINSLNAGAGFVNHIGHGFRYNMSCGDQSFVNNDAENLTNGDRRFVLYMLNCTATAFDFPCLAEAFLQTGGGAVAVLGSSRAAFALPSRNYNLGFFEALHLNDKINIGETFVESRLAYTPQALFDTADHYTHFLYNMLADPEMIIHTCNLGNTAASYVSSVNLGETAVSVNVTVDGSPRENARVCLQKGTEEYVFGLTDASGDVLLNVTAETAGDFTVTVSGQNMTTHQGSISVNATGTAYVHVTGSTIDDDALGNSDGNGDGLIDAGEIIELGLTFENSGDLNATSVTGTMSLGSPWASPLDTNFSLGNLDAGNSTNSSQLRFSLASNTPDGTVIPITIQSTDGSSVWTDTFNKVVHAPILELTLLTIDDAAPGGNGDGIVQAGETFDLIPSFKNYGTGTVNAVEIGLISGDGDISILDNAATLGDLISLQENTPAPSHLRLTEATLDENSMTLVGEDSHNRAYSWDITLRPPAQPATPVLDATTGANIIVTTWTPSTDPDLAGYHVYRGTSGSGPWTRVTVDHTENIAYFRDTELAPSTEYFYYVTAIDDSGNESIPSLTSSINTAPAFLSGWPIDMLSSTSCPPAVGDVTGDGNNEIVAGNQLLYAWDAQGIELVDDDNDPQTWGVFATEVSGVTAAVVLANFDPEPGLEVFATVFDDSNKCYVLRSDGSIAPGWPTKPNPGGSLDGFWGSPGAVDLDGDGVYEVFAPSRDGNLYAWNADGTPVGASEAWASGLGTWSRCSPTFANLDGDPEPEIVYGDPNGNLHVWNRDGSYFPTYQLGNYPFALGTAALSSTAIGDVNNDGTQDIVFITENDEIHVIDSRQGTNIAGWPQIVSVQSNPVSPSPALADFDFDGFLEIVVANNAFPVSGSAIRVYDHLGNVLPGWPIMLDSHTSECSPIVADFSGDGVPDIVFGNEAGFIYGWDKDGNELTGFPLTVGDFVRATPSAVDADKDGDIDLVLSGWDKNLYIWDFAAPYDANAAQWPTFKHDMQRTGYYGFHPQTPTDVGNDPEVSAPPTTAFLSQNYPNPFNPMTSIRYGVPQVAGGAARVSIRIFDVNGRIVRDLVSGTQPPGRYAAIWDGRNDEGRLVGSGVYFYRLDVGDVSFTNKMLLMK